MVDNVLEPVDRRYSDLGGARSGLGLPVTDMAYGQNGTMARRLFKSGLISYSEAVSSQPVEVLGRVYPVYRRVGEEAGPLGRPLFTEEETLDRLNQMQRFEGGVISSFWGGYLVSASQTPGDVAWWASNHARSAAASATTSSSNSTATTGLREPEPSA